MAAVSALEYFRRRWANACQPHPRRGKRQLRFRVLAQGLGLAERSVLRTAAPPQTPSAITASIQKTKLATKAPQKAKNPTPNAFVTRTGIGAGFN